MRFAAFCVSSGRENGWLNTAIDERRKKWGSVKEKSAAVSRRGAMPPGSHSAFHMSTIDLTPRQKQVAVLLSQGLKRKEIARVLGSEFRPLSLRTVDVHIQALAAKLPKDDLPASRRVRKWMRDVYSLRPTNDTAAQPPGGPIRRSR